MKNDTMYTLKTQLKVNMNVFFECEHGTTQEEAEKELDKLLDSITLLTGYRLIFSELEHSLIKDVTA
jgi:hypothetical protein